MSDLRANLAALPLLKEEELLQSTIAEGFYK